MYIWSLRYSMRLEKSKFLAFTIAETLIVLIIMGIVAASTVGITKTYANMVKRFQYYAAFQTLKVMVGELMVDGSMESDFITINKFLPDAGNRPDSYHPLYEGVCQRFSNLINTVGAVDCSLTKSSGTFSRADANFITSGGISYFNFGSSPTLDTGIPHVPGNDYYTVYLDIDGAKHNGVLNDDVMGFKIYRAGQVLPLVDSEGGLSVDYMAASVKYDDFSSGERVVTWVEKSVPYLQAACLAGVASGVDCPVGFYQHTDCVSHSCEVVINSP